MAGYSLSDMFSFAPDGSYQSAGAFQPPDTSQGFDANLFTQGDNGQPIAWSPPEQTRRDSIDTAYNASKNPALSAATSFNNRFQPPQQLGSDVFSGIAQGGLWMPQGSNVSGGNQPIQARIDQGTGNIVVTDPRGGDGSEPLYTYDPTGKFLSMGMGQKAMSPAQGILTVLAAASGFGALGTMAAGGAAGLSGASGAAGLIPKSLLPDIMGSPQINSSGATGANMAINSSPSFGGLSSLGSLFGGGASGGGTGGGFDLNGLISQLGGLSGIAGLGAGAVGFNNQNQAGQSMIDFLKNQQATMQQQGQDSQKGLMDFINGQQSKIDNLYNPGTPEANLMQQEMNNKDAAAGRNSQYGVRSVDLAAKLAGIKGGLDAQFAGSSIPAVNSNLNQAASNTNSFTQGTSTALANALGLQAGAPNSLLSALGAAGQRQQGGGSSGLPSGLQQFLNSQSTGGNLTSQFNNTFGGGFSGGSDSLTGLGVDGSIPQGAGFNFNSPILDSNGVGSIGNSGIGFGNFGNGLDAFSGGSGMSSLPQVSDALDWFL